ncbi:hypothetical protein CPB84DRAFT_1753143 [Gymnopilus junonius]|uniref:ATPase AAA-type core domain-containing protein n=1 Tax=Gymnopilus junonius TaxID=109634 RepID=A0A9P5TGM3_GYMJU|nr:hypothetical protein CPB84DRAFT_1753143 [Gymnopilus junonius]
MLFLISKTSLQNWKLKKPLKMPRPVRAWMPPMQKALPRLLGGNWYSCLLAEKLLKMEDPLGTSGWAAGCGQGHCQCCQIIEEWFGKSYLPTLLFDDNNSMMHINASKYSEKHSISRLTGAPPGYVCYELEVN